MKRLATKSPLSFAFPLAMLWLLLGIIPVSAVEPGNPGRWPDRQIPSFEACFEGKDAAFVVLDVESGKRITFGGERCALRLPPCSTFKLPHALIGLECGILTGPDQRFPWDGAKKPIKAWEREQTLHSSMVWSVVPVYQWLAAQIGSERMRAWLERFQYGNCDISSGQTTFWLGGSLAISAEEQVEFLRRLVDNRLPVASSSRAVLDRISRLERFPDGEYHGKTGSSNPANGWDVGWWVGWITRGNDRYVFAANVRGHEKAGGMVVRRYAERALKALGLLEVTREERLALDFQRFDQDLKGGWRSLSAVDGDLEAAKLLEEYLDVHDRELEGWQRVILHFHAGQSFAFAGEYGPALPHFRRSFHPAEADRQAPLRWNAYVRATIAFLKNDLPALLACRAAMSRGPQDPNWVGPNQAVVDRLVAGIGKPYRAVYGGEPRLNP